MAAATSNSRNLKLDALAKTVVAVERQKKGGHKKIRKKSSKEITIELSGLAEQAVGQDPHQLAQDGELDMLKVLFETTDLGFRVPSDKQSSTLLHDAARTNQVETMRFLIEMGSPINGVDADGNTALHVATNACAFEAIQFLLNKSADNTILNNSQDAALHIAVRSGNVDLVNVFLQHESVDLIVAGYRKRTPLHIAAEHDLVDVVDAFNNAICVVKQWKEKASFRLCAADSDNLTPIHFAARCGSAKVLRYMISHCTEHGYPIEAVLKFIDEEQSTPLHVAIDSGHLNVVKVLLEFGASPIARNGDQIPPFHLACFQGRLEMVEAMVEQGGLEIIHEPSSSGQTPLHWGSRSIHSGHIIRYLISKGANLSHVDSQGQTALHSAIIFGSLEAVKELTKDDGDSLYITDNLGRNVIHYAVFHNRKAILLTLLKLPNAYELVRQQDKSGQCALHYALESSQEDLISCLVSAIQAKISNLKNEAGSNYLHLAARNGNWKGLSILLETPAASLMTNEIDNIGSTPLHQAAMHGHLTCVELLLSHGAMIHKCYSGYTPFHTAVCHGHSDCAKALFKAHPFQKEWTDDHGNTGLHLAVTSGSVCALRLCLDLNIPITRNEQGQTFLDMLIGKDSRPLWVSIIEHDRWQECLDFPVLEGEEHHFLYLVKSLPDVAMQILDRCHKMSILPKGHPEYYEKFDFKYLRLHNEDLVNEEEEISQDSEEEIKKETDMMSEASVQVRRNTPNFANVVGLGTHQPLEALTRMVESKQVGLLIHPVVARYLKLKWRGYGRLIYTTQFLLYFLQVMLLSVFIVITPPARLNISEETYKLLSENVTLSEVSIASTTVRFLTLFVCIINMFILLANIFSIGLRVLNFLRYEAIWVTAVSIISSYAFLIPWRYQTYGFSSIYWEAGAIASFMSWFGILLLIKPYDFFGVYVTMFIEVLSTLIKVLFICLLFLLSFTFSFYILVGDVLPFKTVGDSMFITFSYILEDIDYETYVTRSRNRSLQHPNLTYVFVVGAAVVLAIALGNFLVGLAVGDIDSIRRNAIVKQRADEIRIFRRMDSWLPRIIVQCHDKRFHTVCFNSEVTFVRRVWRKCWRSLKETEADDEDVYKLISNQQREIMELKTQIRMQATAEAQRHEELKQMLHVLTSRVIHHDDEP